MKGAELRPEMKETPGDRRKDVALPARQGEALVDRVARFREPAGGGQEGGPIEEGPGEVEREMRIGAAGQGPQENDGLLLAAQGFDEIFPAAQRLQRPSAVQPGGAARVLGCGLAVRGQQGQRLVVGRHGFRQVGGGPEPLQGVTLIHPQNPMLQDDARAGRGEAAEELAALGVAAEGFSQRVGRAGRLESVPARLPGQGLGERRVRTHISAHCRTRL
jgi:hypothetical protein